MTQMPSFGKLVPGFDFLQSLVSNAGAAMPSIGQWVAPTLDPEEIDKRIGELRTVQFWLEQNARMLGATIQALEVQRMTLSTLKTMDVQMSDLRESLKIKLPDPEPRVEAEPEEEPEEPQEEAAPEPEEPPAAKTPRRGRDKAPDAAGGAKAPPGVADPMQWWGALTQQFTQLASAALKEAAGGVPAAPAAATAAAAAPAPAKKAARKTPAKKAAAGKRGAA